MGLVASLTLLLLEETIQLIPEAGRLRIEVRGALGAILRFVSGPGIDKGADRLVSALGVQIKGDAGTRNRRCQYVTVAI